MKLDFEKTAQGKGGLWLSHMGKTKHFIPVDKISRLIPLSVEDEDTEDQYHIETQIILLEQIDGIELLRISNATPTTVYQTLSNHSDFFEILTSVQDDPDDVGVAFIANKGIIAIRYDETGKIDCASIKNVWLDQIYGEGHSTLDLDFYQTPLEVVKHIETLFEGIKADDNWLIKPNKP